MWHLNRIPKILHTFWGGDHLLYIRYLTLKTFIKHNPDWRVVVWYPKVPYRGQPSWNYMKGTPVVNDKVCKNYLSELPKLNVEMKEVDFDKIGFARQTPEVHKADFIRIVALHQQGGLWTDMDILYFAPIENMKANCPENADKDVFVCIADYGHSTGFNLAVKNSEFFEILQNSFNGNYKVREYQCWGPDLFNKYFRNMDMIPKGVNLDMDVVYAYDCHHVSAGELMRSSPVRFTEGSIGCHWYGGNVIWTDFLNRTGGGEKNLPNTIIGNLIKNV